MRISDWSSDVCSSDLGTSYHLIKAAAPGAFHPKITMLLGESKARLMVGSANLTALGLGGNKEQVASITWSSDAPENAKFFMSALAYLRRDRKSTRLNSSH